MTIRKLPGPAGLAAALILATSASGSAAVTEAQARAKCAKLAQTNASTKNQQRYADACVAKMMAGQKK